MALCQDLQREGVDDTGILFLLLQLRDTKHMALPQSAHANRAAQSRVPLQVGLFTTYINATTSLQEAL